METVSVLQLGTTDFSTVMQISECAEWYYEPNFSELPKKDFDVIILDREITSEEFDFLVRVSKAYCLFLTENVVPRKGSVTGQFFKRRMGKRISTEELRTLLESDLPDYFPTPYGEKYEIQNLSVAQGFKGSVSWRGYEGVDLNGDYGEDLTQTVFWRNTIPILKNQAVEFWLEYKKDDTVEIVLEIQILQFQYGSIPSAQSVWTFSEDELKDIVYVENKRERGFIFASLKAKGHGCMTAIPEREREISCPAEEEWSPRRGKKYFIILTPAI